MAGVPFVRLMNGFYRLKFAIAGAGVSKDFKWHRFRIPQS